MNRQILILPLACFLLSCNAGDGNQATKEATETQLVQGGSKTKEEAEIVPSEEQESAQDRELTRKEEKEEPPISYEFKEPQFFKLKDSIEADFNGDGIVDRAVFRSEGEVSGVIIVHGQTNETFTLGLGNSFEEIGDDFSWVDSWGLLEDSITFEIIIQDSEIIGDTLIRLENPSLVIQKEELGGGVITFRKGKYEWIHQAD